MQILTNGLLLVQHAHDNRHAWNTYNYINVGNSVRMVAKDVDMSLMGVNRGTLELAVAHDV
jgi:hypothetical protein